MNHVQVIGSHNSFKRAPQPELLDAIKPYWKDASGIDYDHLSLTDQLNLGLRNLEFDVCYDPEGGRYADPMGERLLKATGKTPWPREDADKLRTPGFKMLHDPDFDFRCWHIDFADALDELRAWSERHPDHFPVLITMNCKQGSPRVPGAAQLAEFDDAAFEKLNATVLNHLGRERLLTPDDVRGTHATLAEAITKSGWPSVDAARGKFFFALDEGGKTRARYLAKFPGLRGAVYFPQSVPNTPEAAVFIMNDPIKQEAEIRSLVQQGFIVRTRADADTREARTADYRRFDAAKRSGAQVITTDYYIPDRKLGGEYQIRFDGGTFERSNPILCPPVTENRSR